MKDMKEDRFIVSVKVGPKGQITIPAAARKMFNIKEGDTIMVMGDKNTGVFPYESLNAYYIINYPLG